MSNHADEIATADYFANRPTADNPDVWTDEEWSACDAFFASKPLDNAPALDRGPVSDTPPF